MKKSIFTILCFIFIAQVYAYSQNQPSYKEIDKVKNFTKEYVSFPSVKAYGGNTISSEELKGVNVFYLFGSENCSPCLALGKQMTILLNEKRYEGKDIKFVYFIAETNNKTLDRFVNKYKIEWDYMIDMPLNKMQEIGLFTELKPTYVLVDKTGKVVYKGMGFPFIAKDVKNEYERSIATEIDKLL